VANAARHAGPAQVTVRLHADSRSAWLEVADDGRGFDPDAEPADAGGLGLHTMRDRVTELGGRLTIDSAPGEGTRVRACFPLAGPGAVAAGVMEEAR
jgi:signal transduction histidine kinase